MSAARFDRDDLIESRIERIMGDAELLKTEINELDFFADSRVIDAIQKVAIPLTMKKPPSRSLKATMTARPDVQKQSNNTNQACY